MFPNQERERIRRSEQLNLNVQVKHISIVTGNWWIDLYAVKIAKSLLVIYLQLKLRDSKRWKSHGGVEEESSGNLWSSGVLHAQEG